jgi:hypothetical protein
MCRRNRYVEGRNRDRKDQLTLIGMYHSGIGGGGFMCESTVILDLDTDSYILLLLLSSPRGITFKFHCLPSCTRLRQICSGPRI